MKTNHKIILSSLAAAAVVAFSAGAAEARTNLSISLGAPAYMEPAPVYYAPPPVYAPAPVYYEPGIAYYNYSGREAHRHYDWNYWHGQPHPGGRWHR